MLAHVYNPRTSKTEEEDQAFKVSLGYIDSLKIAWAMFDSVSK